MVDDGTGLVERAVDYGPSAERFRILVRAWLDEHGRADLRGVPEREIPHSALRGWADDLTAAGLMCVTWPKEYGGQGRDGIDITVLNEEFARAQLPRATRGVGELLVGPALLAHGTEEQKRRLLPPIVNGDHRYCQGFSEPDAGSDLAGLRTRGVVEGDELAVTGHKTWTSHFTDANRVFVLCRTDPQARRHRGLSYVLLSTERGGRPNGVEFHPIVRMNGTTHFAETLLTAARAPLDDVVGGLGNGWEVAMTTLGSERGGEATTRHLTLERTFWDLVALARERGLAADPAVREQLAWAFEQIAVIRCSGLELAAEVAAGHPGAGSGNGSAAKIRWSEFARRLGELGMEVSGARSLVVGDGYALDRWQDDFLVSRAHTVWGGTAEIQRNIIAERVLGLPREPRDPSSAKTRARPTS